MNRNSARKCTKGSELLPSKYMRKVVWRLIVKSYAKEGARFIGGHFRELKTSEARYEDLLGEAGHCYSSYLKPLYGG